MSESMKAVAVKPQAHEVCLVEHPAPRLDSDTGVKVRSLDVGICGTDREICTFVYGDPPAGSDYLVLGHESLGEVVETGPGVTDLKPGDFVVPSVRRPCPDPQCRPCRNGLQDYCRNSTFVERGIKQMHGYMTEYYVEDRAFLYPVSPEIRDIAVLAEPLTIAEKGVEMAFTVQQRLPWASESGRRGEGLNAVVLGAGPIGQLGAMKLVAEGFKVTVYSRSKAPNPKADLVESIGAEYISNLEVSPAELAAHVGSIDLVYEAIGVARVSFDVLAQVGSNGVFIFTGIPAPGNPIDIDANQLMRRLVLENIAVIGTVNAGRQAFRDAIADLGEFNRRWPDAIRGLITSKHPVGDFRELLLDKATGIKNLISFEQDIR